MMEPSVSKVPVANNAHAQTLSRRLRYGLEASGFFLVIFFFRLFSIERASALGGWIGRSLIALTPASRRGMANLRLAFPEKNDAERASILKGMWDNLGRVMAEYAHLDKMRWMGTNARIEVSGVDIFDSARARGKGIIFVCGHFGNWEILQKPAREYGLTGATVVRPTNNPIVNRWLEKLRTRNGMPEQVAKGPHGTRRVFTLLRKGDTVCFLVDQRASEGILVPFFGLDAFTTPAPAALALKLGSAVVPVWSERTSGARFHMHIYPVMEAPDTGNPDRDLVEFTAAITRFIEERIRERPEQWLWIHKRWVDENAPKRKRAQALSPGRGGATSATSKRV
jgi:Kdo2-lipid IVA lauroyltransferase/acyltransferase